MVDRTPRVIQRRSLEYDAARSNHTRNGEHPQEKSIEHHGHVLPVLDHLVVSVGVLDVLSDELDALDGLLDLGGVGPLVVQVAAAQVALPCGV